MEIPEFFHITVEVESLSKLERFISVKFQSEMYDGHWTYMNKRHTVFEHNLFLFMTKRTCLRGFRYLLTEYHTLYICAFSGTIAEFRAHMTGVRFNYLNYFVDCAKYLLDDVFANLPEDVVKCLQNEQKHGDDENPMQQLLSMETIA